MTTLQGSTTITFDPLEYRIARIKRRWTIRYLADQLDYSPCWITQCELGRNKPSKRLVKAWTNALDL